MLPGRLAGGCTSLAGRGGSGSFPAPGNGQRGALRANILGRPLLTFREMELPRACLDMDDSKTSSRQCLQMSAEFLPSLTPEIVSCHCPMGEGQTGRLPCNKEFRQVESLFSSWPHVRVGRLISSSSSKPLPGQAYLDLLKTLMGVKVCSRGPLLNTCSRKAGRGTKTRIASRRTG